MFGMGFAYLSKEEKQLKACQQQVLGVFSIYAIIILDKKRRIEMKKIVKVILWAGLVFLLVGCASNTAENIEVNDDKVPSVYSVIGEKKIVGTNSEVKNKVRMTTLTYKAGSISEKELQKYIEYLREKRVTCIH